MIETFKWAVSVGADGETEFDIKTVQYGNGYEQNISIGRNSQREVWNVSRRGSEELIAEIKAFIMRHGGTKPFYWTPPLGEQGLFIAQGLKPVAHGGSENNKLYTLSWQMKQVFTADTTQVSTSPIYSINGKTSVDGAVTLNYYDVSADPAGTSKSAITALKRETDPFQQYLLKAKLPAIPDIKPLEELTETLKTDLETVTGRVDDLEDYTSEIHTELEGVSTALFTVADRVTEAEVKIVENTEQIAAADKVIAANNKGISDLKASQIKTINGQKPDKTGDLKLIDDEEASDSTTFSSMMIDREFKGLTKSLVDTATELDKEIKGNAVPLFSVFWYPSRDSIPSGFIAADGQELSALAYPKIAEALANNVVPTVTEEEWQSDKTKRGSYVANSSEDHFRLPDYNGRNLDSLGSLFLRGDNGQAPVGEIQLDGVGNVSMPITTSTAAAQAWMKSYDSRTRLNPALDFKGSGWNEMIDAGSANLTEHLNLMNLGSADTRPLNVSGCWVVKLFGAVNNTEEVDLQQLVKENAELSARLGVLENHRRSKRFTFIYPNDGTEEEPAMVVVNKRYVLPNPFLNEPVILIAEVYWNGMWGETGWFWSTNGFGIKATHVVESDEIVVQTGGSAIGYQLSSAIGNPFGTLPNASMPSAPCRVKVWRII